MCNLKERERETKKQSMYMALQTLEEIWKESLIFFFPEDFFIHTFQYMCPFIQLPFTSSNLSPYFLQLKKKALLKHE